jgi:TetR/AcrR family transcriptional repressor of nem operon
MARYLPGHRDQTRRKILETATQLFRTDGYAKSGVAKVMAGAGLTVGGFYAHFASKEALLSEVLQVALDQTERVLLAGLDDSSGLPFVREVARRYLSRRHRDTPEQGCALPSLLGEIGRQSDETREVFEEFFLKLLRSFEPHLADNSGRDRAIALAALLVGGLSLARAVKSKELSDRILLACKRFAVAKEDA